MKAYLALSILACAISTTAKNIHRRADGFLPAAGIPKGGYNAYGGNYDHPETNKFQPVGQKQASSSGATNTGGKKATTQSTKCISKSKLESIVNKYVSTFSGITDGGALAKTIFEEDVKFYSQSIWWTSSSSKINKYAKVNISSPFHRIHQANSFRTMTFLPSIRIARNSSKATLKRPTTLAPSSKDPSPTAATPSPSTGRATSRFPRELVVVAATVSTWCS